MVAKLGWDFQTQLNISVTDALVCIDANVTDIPLLMAGVKPNHSSLILHPQEDGIEQITEYLASQAVVTLHLVCHGVPGQLHLGNTVLNRHNLWKYANSLQQWHIQNLVIWACEVGKDLEFLESLEKVTGAKIAASSQKVGAGIWQLDLGEIETSSPFSVATEKIYGGTLAQFTPASNYPAGFGPTALVMGDLNGDNQLDLAVTNQSSNDVSILLGNGNGSFSSATNFSVGNTPYSIAMGDFNRDNQPDLAVANLFGNNVSILLGNGDGSFSGATNFAVGNLPYSIATGDFNGDSVPDLVTTNTSGNTFSILLANGDGSFSPASNFPTGMSPRSVVIGDFDEDNIADLAIVNYSSNNVSILLGNGDGSFSPPTNFPVDSDPAYIAIGDLNGDNLDDLATANTFSNNVSILFGNGDGSFSPPTNFPTGVRPYFVAIADINGDNLADLLTANSFNDNISILLGNGNGSLLTPPRNFIVGDRPRAIAIGDLNGDNLADLATANESSDDVSILLNITPTVSVFSSLSPQEQGNNPGIFTFRLNNTIATPLTINFGVTGTANNSDDYTIGAMVADPNVISSTGTSITLSPGATGADLIVTPVDDILIDPDETINLTIIKNNPDFFILEGAGSTATLTILDNDIPIVNLTALSDPQENGPTAGRFLVTLDQSSPELITIPYLVGGSAGSDIDYIPLRGSVIIAPGQVSAVIDIFPIDDLIAEFNETISLSLLADPSYTLGSSTSDFVTLIDNDTPGITLDPTISLTTTEAGATAQPTLRLNSQPLADVNITLNSSDPTEGTVTPSELTFTPTNWSTPQTLTITGQDDFISDGDIAYQIIGIPDSLDFDYDDTVPGNQVTINVTNIDNEGAGVTITQTEGFTEVTEGSSTPDTYTIALNTNPIAPVEILVNADGQTQISNNGSSLTSTLTLNFTDTTPQTINVFATNDTTVEGLHTSEITHFITNQCNPDYNSSLTITPVTVSIIDDDITPTPTPVPVPTPGTPPGTTPGTLNTFPVAIADSATTLINIPVTIPVLANDVDLDQGDLIRIESFDNPTEKGGRISLDDNATLDSEDDRLVYTPPSNFLGVDTFNYTITDGEATSTASVSVFVGFVRPDIPLIEFTLEPRFPPAPNAITNRVQGTDNDPIISGRLQNDEILGTDQNDLIFGVLGDDNIFGLAGNDRLYGNEGTDFLVGDLEDDRLIGGLDDDALFGDEGDDLLLGGPGNDFILGGQDQDSLQGDSGDDYLEGNLGNDTVYGGQGNDVAVGNKGDDFILGNNGNDTLIGSEDNDSLLGGMGTDLISGEGGNDTLEGGEENDTLLGGVGDDCLAGGLGNNILQGGEGLDTFFLAGDQGIDTIYDFNPDEDMLNLGDELSLDHVNVMQMVDGVVLKQAENNDIFARILGITVDEISIA